MTPRYGQLYRLKPGSDGKKRPVVIVSQNSINGGDSVVIVPFYSQQLEKRKNLDWCALFYEKEGGLDRDCVPKADEIAKVDKLAINLAAGPIGSFDANQMVRVQDAIRWVLNMK